MSDSSSHNRYPVPSPPNPLTAVASTCSSLMPSYVNDLEFHTGMRTERHEVIEKVIIIAETGGLPTKQRSKEISNAKYKPMMQLTAFKYLMQLIHYHLDETGDIMPSILKRFSLRLFKKLSYDGVFNIEGRLYYVDPMTYCVKSDKQEKMGVERLFDLQINKSGSHFISLFNELNLRTVIDIHEFELTKLIYDSEEYWDTELEGLIKELTGEEIDVLDYPSFVGRIKALSSFPKYPVVSDTGYLYPPFPWLGFKPNERLEIITAAEEC